MVVLGVSLIVALNSGWGRASADCSVVAVESVDAAAPLAAECGTVVEATEERTPWTTTSVNADGSMHLEYTISPSRTNVSGEWASIDTDLLLDEDADVIVPESPVYEIELNAGGSANSGDPLGSITREGQRLEVGFPLPLPEPELDGSQAIYMLGDGIRLIVTVMGDGTGFFPIVELESAAASARFQAMLAASAAGNGSTALTFPVTVPDGLQMVPDGAAIQIVDDAGEAIFVIPAPIMWDSSADEMQNADQLESVGGVSASSVADRTATPRPGDQVASMPAVIAGSSVVVTPDAEMLASEDTVWPVYIDPGFDAGTAAEWVAVRTGGYTGTLYKWGDMSSTMPGEGVGRCSSISSCNVDYTSRLAWEFGGMDLIRDLTGAQINNASMKVNGVSSYNCTPAKTSAYTTDSVSAGSTFGLKFVVYNGSVTSAQRPECDSGWKSFDATEALVAFAEGDFPTITIGLRAVDETSMAGWKRFRHDATLTVNYDRPPSPPTAMMIDGPPARGCATGASARPWINDLTPTLSAVVKDADGGTVSAVFQIIPTGETEPVWQSATTAPEASGTRVSATVSTAAALKANVSYSWHVTSVSGGLWSGWGAWCEFMIDRTSPAAPKITPIPSGTGIQAVYETGLERGGLGLKGMFAIDRNGSSDVVQFLANYDNPNPITVKTPATDGTYDIQYVPSEAGVHSLYAQSVDRAGNKSPVTEYAFDVASPEEDAIWKLDEGAGTTAADTGNAEAGPLKVAGPTWAAGPHELFGSRSGDKALKFDGVDDYAYSGAPVLDTTKSFTVVAHVWLDPTAATKSRTVLSQDGTLHSAFRLRYNSSDCVETVGQGCWEFLMKAADVQGNTAYSNTRSTAEVKTGEWVMLVGEYDSGDDKARLRVCNSGTPDEPSTAVPVKTEATTSTLVPWKAGGAFTVGRAISNGVPGDFFLGQIDNVRVFSGEIVDEAKVRRLCQGAEAEAFGGGKAGNNAIDPTGPRE
ncbi:hypothetical protein ASF62_11085 [Leifsonia sp. Leaf325]|nr:LamG-like jellyroll fold domain-containing protein [Leifsonia sp. Leaf325]KQQ94605.1 hypothetical protein ASF62_11085 [Leifsonia sp. Leaf325]